VAIKVQPFVIDDAVLDLIGNEFKFDHAKGLTEWLKNSADAYLREQTPDDSQHIWIRLQSNGPILKRIECIDFIGMRKDQIDDAFKRFFDPDAAKKGAKEIQIRTFGGHGNGGKFYMRQMFRTSSATTWRDGKLNIFGFNSKRQYGFEEDFEDRKVSLEDALKIAGIQDLEIPKEIMGKLSSGETGFTVVRGITPNSARGTAKQTKLIEALLVHPQARRLMDRKPIGLIYYGEKKPTRLRAPSIQSKEGFEEPTIVNVPAELTEAHGTVTMCNKKYPWPGRLVLRTSADPLRSGQASLNTIDILGEAGVIASYRIHELGPSRYSGQAEFVYGECECPILEDPDDDCVRNDRQKLIENERTISLLAWIRDQVELLTERMETKLAQEKKKQDLRNTSLFNEMLNRWKNRFMNKIWSEVFVGRGPAGLSGSDQGSGIGGLGKGGGNSIHNGSSSSNGHEGGSETRKKPKFPQVLISGQDADPLNPLSTEPFQCDKRHPAVYQRTKDVELGIYWINTSRPLADKIISAYSSDSTRWREYLFQRYVDIIVKEAVYQLGTIETSLSADDINRCIDDITTRIHDEAAKDLNSFLFEEGFGLE